MKYAKRNMFLILISLAGFSLMSAQTLAEEKSAPFETRCGWFDNPTPANITLYDRDGEWIIGVQGGYQVASDWDWPKFGEEWESANGHYGFGCACLQVKVNAQTHQIVAIRKKTRAKPLQTCMQDPALKKWKDRF